MSSLIQQHAKLLAGAAFLALACMTSACSVLEVQPESRADALPQAVKLAPGEGLVLMRLAGTRRSVTRFGGKFDSLTVWNETLQKEFVLNDRADTWSSHNLFVKGLPPGHYTVRNIKGHFHTVTVGTNTREAFPGFTVSAGRMTDLGNIIYIRPHDPAAGSRFLWAQVDTPGDSAASLRQLAPALATMATAQPALGWDRDARLDALQQRYAGLRATSMQGNAPARLGDGSLLFGEAFGMIAVRTPQGEWHQIDTPTALPIRAVHAAPDGTLFAGSEDAQLLMRRAGQRDWTRLALPIAGGSVLDIGALPGTDDLLVVLELRDRYVGLSSRLASPGEWKEQFSHPRLLFRNTNADDRGFVYRSGTGVALATGNNISRQRAVSYDSKTGSWTSATLDVDGTPLTWAMLPNGSLARFEAVPMSRDRFFYVSADGGKRWETRAELHATWGPLMFLSDDTGYVVRSLGPPDLEFDADPANPAALWRTDDGGRSWKAVGTAPAYPLRVVDLGQPGHLGYVSNDGRFFSSTDGGKNWSLEKEVL